MSIKCLLTLPILALVAGAAFDATAGAGQRILSTRKTCQMTVPAGWEVGQFLKSTAQSPDRATSAVISSGGDDTTLAQAKAILESTYKPVKVFEDSPHRLWYAYQAPNGGIGWYVGVPGGHNNVCGAQITFRQAAMADAMKPVALSVAPVP